MMVFFIGNSIYFSLIERRRAWKIDSGRTTGNIKPMFPAGYPEYVLGNRQRMMDLTSCEQI
jgi:hypothetical protein